MKDIRPSTWAILIVLAMMIFLPPLFIDEEMFANTPEKPGPGTITTPPPPPRRGPQVPNPHGPQVPDSNEPDNSAEPDSPAGE